MPSLADEPLSNEQFDSDQCYDEERNKMYFLNAERPFINVREISLSFMESRGIIFSFALIPFIWAPKEMIKFTIEGLPLAKYVTSEFPYYNSFIFMCPPYSSNLFKFVYFEADIIESGPYIEKSSLSDLPNFQVFVACKEFQKSKRSIFKKEIGTEGTLQCQ